MAGVGWRFVLVTGALLAQAKPVQAQTQNQTQNQTYILPSSAFRSGTNGAEYRTDVRILNLETTAVTVSATFYDQAAASTLPASPFRDRSAEPGVVRQRPAVAVREVPGRRGVRPDPLRIDGSDPRRREREQRERLWNGRGVGAEATRGCGVAGAEGRSDRAARRQRELGFGLPDEPRVREPGERAGDGDGEGAAREGSAPLHGDDRAASRGGLPPGGVERHGVPRRGGDDGQEPVAGVHERSARPGLRDRHPQRVRRPVRRPPEPGRAAGRRSDEDHVVHGEPIEHRSRAAGHPLVDEHGRDVGRDGQRRRLRSSRRLPRGLPGRDDDLLADGQGTGGLEGRGCDRHGRCPVFRGHLSPAGRRSARPGEDPGRHLSDGVAGRGTRSRRGRDSLIR